MKTHNRVQGFSSVLLLFVVTVLFFAVIGVHGLAGSSMLRSNRELAAAQAFQLAQAAADYEVQELQRSLVASFAPFTAYERNYEEMPLPMPDGASGTVSVVPVGNGKTAWLTSEAYMPGARRSVRVMITGKNVGVWENAVFAGTGATGRAINGNVDIRGSVHLLGDGEAYTDLNNNGTRDPAEPFEDRNGNGTWDPGEPFTDLSGDNVWNPAEPYNDSNDNGIYDPPITRTDFNSAFGGKAYIGNNYDGVSSNISSRIPTIPVVNGLKSLGTEVRVKHGLIGLSGSAAVGMSGNINDQKGMVDGTFVNDGWAGNQGSSSVFSDNGSREQYDLGDLVHFPLISGIGARQYRDPRTGTLYQNFKAYLDANSMQVGVGTIDATSKTPIFFADGRGNSIQWFPPTEILPGKLVVNGIVKMDLDLALGLKKQTIYYEGRGTLYSTGSIDIHATLLPVDGKKFPTDTALGFVALHDINLAMGIGDSQLSMVGAFYAQGTIRSAKQNQIAGTFVASYYDMGTNVPNIYQVPELGKNLPPGMPGSEPIVAVKRKSWRERVPPVD